MAAILILALLVVILVQVIRLRAELGDVAGSLPLPMPELFADSPDAGVCGGCDCAGDFDASGDYDGVSR